MRVLTPLVILALPIVLAHNTPFRSAHHAARALSLNERENLLALEKVFKRGTPSTSDDETSSEGVLGGIVSGSSDDDISSISTAPSSIPTLSHSVTPTISPTPSHSATITSVTPLASSTDPDTSSSAISRSSPSSAVGPPSSIASSSGVGGLAVPNTTSTLSSASTSNSTTISSTSASSTQTSISSAPPQTDAHAVTTVTTDPAGQTSIITLVYTASATESSSNSTADSSNDSSGGSSISTGAIIGISVAVGAVVLGLVGCAVWRMKRRHGDEDEVIRWPELNRHGDSDAHHALPARSTGKHGFETSPLERSLSNSSSIFAPSSMAPIHSAPPMALNGSNFGAASSLEDYDEKESSNNHHFSQQPTIPQYGSPPPGYENDQDHDEDYDYTSFPPVVQAQPLSHGVGLGGYESGSEDAAHDGGLGTGAGYPRL
ncbi:hypothetical protein BCR39DRAFT_555861 [Naematelia encephala]|uniref:Mid2 domain-containing protein n=1 Tax=Naematelia encephala TaxID=71784 RepID=A0A1Y2BNI5_9TREE|nr:hypothetical protein BCR39DRAFT_555861 [Naematelia encephala]